MKANKVKNVFNFVAAWLATRIPILVPSLTLGFGWGSRYIKDWYERNGVYRFKPGDEIELGSRAYFGYGIRPKGIVVGYKSGEDGSTYYVINMTSDNFGDWHRFFKEGWVPSDVTRSTKIEVHFKWNIEHHFKRCRPSVGDDALPILACA